MENSIKNQLEESRKDGTLKETLQGMGFNRLQSVEIAKGLNNEVDITKYADKKYDAAQMKSIRLALEEGMDITPFADIITRAFRSELISVINSGGRYSIQTYIIRWRISI